MSVGKKSDLWFLSTVNFINVSNAVAINNYMFSKVFLYEVVFLKKEKALDVFLSTLFFNFLLSFLSYHSTMQCNFVSNGWCCGVTRSCINIIFLTSGMHLQHYCVRRLWSWNSGNVLISCECINTNLFKYDTLPLSILKLSLHLVCRLGLGLGFNCTLMNERNIDTVQKWGSKYFFSQIFLFHLISDVG